jgi:putative transposase
LWTCAGGGAALAALWPTVPVQGGTVQQHRNLLAHALKKLHDERSADDSDMIDAADAQTVIAKRQAFLRKCKRKCRSLANRLEQAGDRLFPLLRYRPAPWRSIRTSNAIERLHEEFKRRIKTQSVLPREDTACRLFGALLAGGQIRLRKVDGWPWLRKKPIPIDLVA